MVMRVDGGQSTGVNQRKPNILSCVMSDFLRTRCQYYDHMTGQCTLIIIHQKISPLHFNCSSFWTAMWQVATWVTWSVLISFHQPRAFWFNRNYMESPWVSKHIFPPSLKEEPRTNTPDVTSNVAVIQSFFHHVRNPIEAQRCQAQASLSAVRSRASVGIYFGIIWTANELLLVMQLHCDFTGVLWVNLVLTPVAMDAPVGPALLLQKWVADERSRQMEGGWEGRKKNP